jgi:hypothetical protein
MAEAVNERSKIVEKEIEFICSGEVHEAFSQSVALNDTLSTSQATIFERTKEKTSVDSWTQIKKKLLAIQKLVIPKFVYAQLVSMRLARLIQSCSAVSGAGCFYRLQTISLTGS